MACKDLVIGEEGVGEDVAVLEGVIVLESVNAEEEESLRGERVGERVEDDVNVSAGSWAEVHELVTFRVGVVGPAYFVCVKEGLCTELEMCRELVTAALFERVGWGEPVVLGELVFPVMVGVSVAVAVPQTSIAEATAGESARRYRK